MLFVFRDIDNHELAEGLGDFLKVLVGDYGDGLDIEIELNDSQGKEWCQKVASVFKEIMEAEPG